MTTYGFHTNRFKDNPEEKRFSKAWHKQQAGDTLAYLLAPATARRPPSVSQNDNDIAATVIQWLGSSVGQCFLRDLGYEKERAIIKEAKPSKKVVKLKRFVGQLRGLLIRVNSLLSELEKLDDL